MARIKNKPPKPDDEMTFWDHLGELRDRVFRAVLALLVCTLAGLIFAEPVLQFIIKPYGDQVLVTSPTEGLTNVLIVSLTLGASFAMPVMVYQILAFVMPGLQDSEKKWIFLGVPSATVLFVLGAAFAYFVMLPPAIAFLTGIYPTVFKYQLKLDDYVPFVLGIVFWLGVAFQMPLIIFVMAKVGIVSAGVLAKQWRYAVVIIAIIAAMITPTPDPINMSIVMAPLLVLYVMSIGLAAIARRGAATPALLDPEEELKS